MSAPKKQVVRMTHKRCAALALAVLLAGGAAAQPKKGEATLGGGAGSGPTLTRDQLRDCLVEQDQLRTAGQALARDAQGVDAEKNELARAGAELKAQFEAIDKSDEAALKAHIERTRAHDQKVDEWNAKLPAFNERVAALQKRNADWKGACADRRYKEDDLILLQARRQVPAGAK